MHVIANLFRRERSQIRRFVERITNSQRVHFRHEAFDVATVNRFGDDEALRRDAGLPAIHAARFHTRRGRIFQIGARHNDERIAPAQLQHALLDLPRGPTRHLRAGAFAPGQGHGLHSRIVNHRGGCFGFDQQRLKGAIDEAGALEDSLQRKRALRDVGRVF